MKKLQSVFAAASAFGIFASTGFAAPFNFEGLQAVTKIAFEDFSAANPDHVQHFTGYKAWQSGDDAKVKIYVNHDGMAMEFNFLCHVHDEGPECHKQ